GTQMKATGEVMAIGRTLEESLLKAVRSLEIGADYLYLTETSEMTREELETRLVRVDDERLFLLGEWFRRGYTVEDAHELTKIDRFFLVKLERIIKLELQLQNADELEADVLL